MQLLNEYVIFIFLSPVKNENFNEYKNLIVFVLYIWRSFFKPDCIRKEYEMSRI